MIKAHVKITPNVAALQSAMNRAMYAFIAGYGAALAGEPQSANPIYRSCRTVTDMKRCRSWQLGWNAGRRASLKDRLRDLATQ